MAELILSYQQDVRPATPGMQTKRKRKVDYLTVVPPHEAKKSDPAKKEAKKAERRKKYRQRVIDSARMALFTQPYTLDIKRKEKAFAGFEDELLSKGMLPAGVPVEPEIQKVVESAQVPQEQPKTRVQVVRPLRHIIGIEGWNPRVNSGLQQKESALRSQLESSDGFFMPQDMVMRFVGNPKLMEDAYAYIPTRLYMGYQMRTGEIDNVYEKTQQSVMNTLLKRPDSADVTVLLKFMAKDHGFRDYMYSQYPQMKKDMAALLRASKDPEIRDIRRGIRQHAIQQRQQQEAQQNLDAYRDALSARAGYHPERVQGRQGSPQKDPSWYPELQLVRQQYEEISKALKPHEKLLSEKDPQKLSEQATVVQGLFDKLYFYRSEEFLQRKLKEVASPEVMKRWEVYQLLKPHKELLAQENGEALTQHATTMRSLFDKLYQYHGDGFVDGQLQDISSSEVMKGWEIYQKYKKSKQRRRIAQQAQPQYVLAAV